MRDRGSSVLMIMRVKVDCVYYVFPGGGIEEGETPSEAAKRETFEELGVEINIKEKFGEVEFNGRQYFFLADIIEGVFGTGSGEEFLKPEIDKGSYHPVWVEISTLSQLDVRPKEIAEKVLTIFG